MTRHLVKRFVLLLTAALLVPAGAALADTASTTPVTTTTSSPVIPPPSKPKPKPKPKPKLAPAAKGAAAIFLPGIYVLSKQPVSIPGRPVRFNGVVRPFVPNQWVNIKATQGGKVIKHWKLRIKPSKKGYGEFSESVKAPGAGNVYITAAHAKTPQQMGFKTTRTYNALSTNVGPGSRGGFVDLLQQRLLAMHFYIPQSGVYDNGTELAVDAYHRLLGWGTYKTLDGRTISYLMNGWGEFKVRFPSHGEHAEGNLTHQLLALIDGSKVVWIFPISSGKPSTPTILGDFRVYQRTPGYLPDGMYYSSFFIRGYAIHGYDPSPDYPASHGCMRLPIPDAITAYNWLAMGDWVDVYYQ